MLDENGGEKDGQTIEEVSCGWSGRGNLENSAILMEDRISGCHRRFELAQSLEGDDSTAEGAPRIEMDILWRVKPGEAKNAAGGENVIRLVISDEGSHTSGGKGGERNGGKEASWLESLAADEYCTIMA